MEEKKGLWLCIEGADYTGKRTQCSLLFDKLTSLSEDNIIVYTHEPTARAKEIKRKLKAEKGEAYKDGLKMSELYIADRVWNEKTIIKPILHAGGIASKRWSSASGEQKRPHGERVSGARRLVKRKKSRCEEIN